ncbi:MULTISPECIES: glycosyltransferase [Hungatella]|uniref:Glycosyltransferase n=1 Tax=Hungatella hathewayi TaxID=154046 RepID=A0A3E4TLF9_9FIRM|nr:MULTISPECIES: glycosyltransferase [Hungatella]RGL91918.1 glycosyltransferase [Hungatella hathewayi]RHM67518.1 glycosyltransferase [Hungatella hathewayi]
MQYSVLMSVYEKEQADFLEIAIESILNQTVKTNDFVIVCDGPLNEQLENVLLNYKIKCPETFNIIKLDKNVGLGIALNKGLRYCKNDLVARMDSDDISVYNRMELQMTCFENDEKLAVCGGYIAEFKENPNEILSIRKVPCNHNDILTWAKKRNPMNHMTVMFRKQFVLDAGSYKKMDFAEDYYLWVRMLMNNDRMLNLNNILVMARIGNGMFQRRGGRQYVKKIYHMQNTFYKIGFINKREFCLNLFIRTINSLAPNLIRERIYKLFLRN